MNSKAILIFLIVNFVSESYAQKEEIFFRKDYNYMGKFQSFYKIHTIPQSWSDAKRVCALEGATLWHPDNDDEAHELLSFWRKTKPNVEWMFTGLSHIFSKDIFETVDGKSISEVYNEWEPGQPDNYNWNQDCVHINLKTAVLDDEQCNLKYSFSCKKTLNSLKWNQQCNMPNLDYTFNKDTGKCYKIHTTPLKWSKAHVVCRAEQSSLAVVRSRSEAEYLANLANAMPKLKYKGSYQRGIYHMGFHNTLSEGWKTVTGTPMTSNPAAWFNNHQPDDRDPDKCSSMLYTGLLINVNCDTKSLFICEHEVDGILSSSNGSEILNPYVGDSVK